MAKHTPPALFWLRQYNAGVFDRNNFEGCATNNNETAQCQANTFAEVPFCIQTTIAFGMYRLCVVSHYPGGRILLILEPELVNYL